MSLPILYSFRRCPYAIRARHALSSTGQQVTLREVVLRDKPPSMLEFSAKGTVPVLVMPTGEVIDESLDIMRWALHTADPQGWMEPYRTQAEEVDALIARNDGEFKHHLDRYKYTNRYEGADSRQHRDAAERFLADLNERLSQQDCLFSDHLTLADAAILPFIRQFANADRSWFDATPYPHLHRWLLTYLDSTEFQALMIKYPQWHAGDDEIVFVSK
jgi:glutathione S-transferase